MEEKKVMVEHKVENPQVVELKAKIAKYEEEVKAHKLVGNLEMANAIQVEIKGLKFQLLQAGGK